MTTFGSLQEEARDRFMDMKADIDRLRLLGIRKELQMRATSNIVVTYPSKQDLEPEGKLPLRTRVPRINNPNTLYMHIPFCSAICSYCDFARSAAGPDDRRIGDYLTLLEQEAAMWRRHHGAPVPVESIYVGGGTPTLLHADALRRALEIIDENFVLAPAGEFTLEASPQTVTFEKLALAKSCGVNRVSMGAESFTPRILTEMRREPDVEAIFSAIDTIKEAGIAHIDVDLIRGYPSQTTADLVRDLEGMQRADTPSVTSYQYSLKPHAIDKKRLKEFALEQDKSILSHIMFVLGAERLGYLHRAPLVDWFIKGPEWVYQQQIQKWLGMFNLIGIGLGAYGYVDGTQYINFEDRKRYGEAVKNRQMPVGKATELSDEEIMRRRMIFGLKGHVDRREFRNTYGVDVTEAPFREELESIAAAGGLDISDATVRLSKAGALFADWIQMAFYSASYKEKERRRIMPPVGAL